MATISTYRAVQVSEFGEPSVMKVGELPVPEVEPGQLLVEVKAAATNPVDTYIRSGNYAKLPTLPYTPGKDAAGVVVKVGEGVSGFAEGDRVYTPFSASGGLAEMSVFDAKLAGHLPDSLSFPQGAAIGVAYATAYRALFTRGKAKAGQTILIHGATGGVGTACLQLGRWAGLRVIGTAGTEDGLKYVTDQGAFAAFNHREGPIASKILEATDGVGVDLAVTMLADQTLSDNLESLKLGGTVAIVGNRGEITINPRALMGRESQAVGVMLGNTSDEEWKETFAALEAAMASGVMNPVVGQTYTGLESAADSHVEVIERASGLPGKVVVIP